MVVFQSLASGPPVPTDLQALGAVGVPSWSSDTRGRVGPPGRHRSDRGVVVARVGDSPTTDSRRVAVRQSGRVGPPSSCHVLDGRGHDHPSVMWDGQALPLSCARRVSAAEQGSVIAGASSDGAPSAVAARPQTDTATARRATFGNAPIPTPVMVGVLGFLLVLALRLSGVVVGPVAVVLAAICFVLAPGPSRLCDRFIVFFAIGFGWLMLLGWIPHFETSIDVPGILLAAVFGAAAANQFDEGRFRLSVRRWPVSTEVAAVVVGAGATLWWAVPLLRMNLSGRLAALFPGWTTRRSSTCSGRSSCTEASVRFAPVDLVRVCLKQEHCSSGCGARIPRRRRTGC